MYVDPISKNPDYRGVVIEMVWVPMVNNLDYITNYIIVYVSVPGICGCLTGQNLATRSSCWFLILIGIDAVLSDDRSVGECEILRVQIPDSISQSEIVFIYLVLFLLLGELELCIGDGFILRARSLRIRSTLKHRSWFSLHLWFISIYNKQIYAVSCAILFVSHESVASVFASLCMTVSILQFTRSSWLTIY